LTATSLLGGAILSGALNFTEGPLTLGGDFVFTSTFTDPLTLNRNFTLASDTILDERH